MKVSALKQVSEKPLLYQGLKWASSLRKNRDPVGKSELEPSSPDSQAGAASTTKPNTLQALSLSLPHSLPAPLPFPAPLPRQVWKQNLFPLQHHQKSETRLTVLPTFSAAYLLRTCPLELQPGPWIRGQALFLRTSPRVLSYWG